METFSGNKAGTGALVSLKEASWLMSVVLAYQPHFLNQPADVTGFWGSNCQLINHMETLNFKANIKCGGCIATVTPFLNDIEQVDGWNVDTSSPDKILTVQTTDTRVGEAIKKAVEQAGYKAEPIPRP